MAWHPLTRLLVVAGPIAIAASYLLTPEDPAAVPPVVRAGDAQAALPPASALGEPGPKLAAAPPLSALTETVERPLFTASRRRPPTAAPDLPSVAAATAPVLTLQGVILAGDKAFALLRHDDTGEIVVLAPGDSLSGWRVDRVEAGSVTLSGPDGTTELPLFPPPP